jgi:hypothetical protein
MALRRTNPPALEGRDGRSALSFFGFAARVLCTANFLTLPAALFDPAWAGGTLVVGMTAGDIPVTTGNTDQGFAVGPLQSRQTFGDQAHLIDGSECPWPEAFC